MNKTVRFVAGVIGAVALLTAGAAAGKVRGAAQAKCASPAEFPSMQISAIQQELMDAALTCGDGARNQYNTFQTSFNPALLQSDRQMQTLFRRVLGRGGNAAYNLFKTDLASKAELRRIHDHAGFCVSIAQKASAVLALSAVSGKPRQAAALRYANLKEFASSEAPVDFEWPILACEVPTPTVVPQPNPLRIAENAAEPAPVATH